MKEYLMLFRGGDDGFSKQSPEAMQIHMKHWADWMGAMAEKGKLGSAQPLTNAGKQVSGIAKTVTDGPFMEGKEMVGGYLICKAENFDEAVEWAKGCPLLEFEDVNVEVREINEKMG
jgi:hypothetical protein